MREAYLKKTAAQEMLPLSEARARRLITPKADAKPRQVGLFTRAPSRDEIREILDWSPFFWTWDLKGKYPEILNHERYGVEARKLFADGEKMLESGLCEGWLDPKVLWGVLPAVSRDESVIVSGGLEIPFLRQQVKKASDSLPYLCLSDYIAPSDDHLGVFIVTAGSRYEEKALEFVRQNDDYSAILAKSIADRVAEALAEWVHLQFRLNMGSPEHFTTAELLAEKYRGIRPAPGYAACPDHRLKTEIWRLLENGGGTGVTLTETLSMSPPASVSGFMFYHPEAKYFRVEQVANDQLASIAGKRGVSSDEARRWLAFQP
jgi:5-methyltetrahydrofolate--homocysteine methyltransferase